MTLISQVIVKCPHCGTLMSDSELMSYSVHRSVNYSDGYTETEPFSGIHDDLRICVQCEGAFFKDKVIDRSLERPDVNYEDYPDAPGLFDMPWKFEENWPERQLKFLISLMEKEVFDDEDDEFRLRTKVWWGINDLIRNLSSLRSARSIKDVIGISRHRSSTLKLYSSYKSIRRANLKRMIYLYIKAADADLLYLANMYREMHDFSKAEEVLDKYEGRETGVQKLLRKKIRQRNDKVFQL